MEEEVKLESDEYYVVIVGEMEDNSADVAYDMKDHKLTEEGSSKSAVGLENDSLEVKFEPFDPKYDSLEIEIDFSKMKEEPIYSPEEEEYNERVMEYVRAMKAQAKASPPPLPKAIFTKEDGQYECMYCEHSSLKEKVAIRHYRFRHGEKHHKCLACNAAFRRYDTMMFHEHHCRAENAELVRKARARMGRVKRAREICCEPKSPRMVKNERQRRKVPCKICSKMICYSNTWTHMRVHSEVKQFECSHCTASFRTKRAKEAHENAHSGSRPFRCNECTNAYTSDNGLRAHKLTHTDPAFRCEYCGRVYRRKIKLNEHIQTRHTVDKTYLCNECGKVLRNKGALQYHTQAHHRDPRYTCEQCGKSYTTLTSLNSHMKIKHGHEIITRKMFFQRLPLMAHVPDYMLELVPEEKGKHSDVVGDTDCAK